MKAVSALDTFQNITFRAERHLPFGSIKNISKRQREKSNNNKHKGVWRGSIDKGDEITHTCMNFLAGRFFFCTSSRDQYREHWEFS